MDQVILIKNKIPLTMRKKTLRKFNLHLCGFISTT